MRQERISPIGTAGDEDAVGNNSHDHLRMVVAPQAPISGGAPYTLLRSRGSV